MIVKEKMKIDMVIVVRIILMSKGKDGLSNKQLSNSVDCAWDDIGRIEN